MCVSNMFMQLFILWFTGITKSIRWQDLLSLLINIKPCLLSEIGWSICVSNMFMELFIQSLVLLLRLNDPFVSQCSKDIYSCHFHSIVHWNDKIHYKTNCLLHFLFLSRGNYILWSPATVKSIRWQVLFFLLINTRSGLLDGIEWSICILCILFSFSAQLERQDPLDDQLFSTCLLILGLVF